MNSGVPKKVSRNTNVVYHYALRISFYGNGGAALVEEDTDWTLLRVSKLTFRALALRQGEENEVLTLETSALKL